MVLGTIGIIVAIALFLILVYKNCVSYWVALLCAIIVALTNELDVIDALFDIGEDANSFLSGMVDLLPTMFRVVFMGAIIGKLYMDSGAVYSISTALYNTFVKNREGKQQVAAAVIVIAVVEGLLTLGGIDGYVLVFTMVPICMYVCRMVNIPRRFVPGMITLNTAFMIFPGAPQIYNVMGVAAANSAGFYEVTSTTGLVPGIIASAIVVIGGVVTVIVFANRAIARGETFEVRDEQEAVAGKDHVPHPVLCVIPLVVIFVLYSIIDLDVFWALLAGMVIAFVLFAAYLPRQDTKGNRISVITSIRDTLNNGSNQYPNALMSVITPAGLASVITGTAVFGRIIGEIAGLEINMLVLTIIFVCVIVALTSSPPATLMIALPIVLGISMATGSSVSAGAITRVGIIAVSTFETLPFNGLVVLTLNLAGCSHKESYKIMFLNTVVYTSIATIVAAALFALFPGLA